jgi:hypothetical protein
MAFREIIVIYFKRDTNPINILCRQNSELANECNVGGTTCRYHYAKKQLNISVETYLGFASNGMTRYV